MHFRKGLCGPVALAAVAATVPAEAAQGREPWAWVGEPSAAGLKTARSTPRLVDSAVANHGLGGR